MLIRFISLLVVVVVAGGCQLAVPSAVDMRPPWLQRRQLLRFDPYPDNDTAPRVEGGRPPGFQHQINEPARSRWVLPHPPVRTAAPVGF
ncbi:MAG: hypothetical protein VB853_08825 [Pirellulales bacterium]|jgi:hypothetical protein